MDGIEDRVGQQGQARQLAQVLLAPHDDIACAACLDALEAYVADQAAGLDYAERQPGVARHLDSCVDCAEAYALLYEQLLGESAAPLPLALPEPDLSFLKAGAGGPLTPAALRAARRAERLPAALASAVERAGGRLRLALSQALLDLLPPPAAPALAFRSADLGAPLFDLALDAPGSEVERLHLSAYAELRRPDRCAVRVQLALRGREWPDLAGVPVALAIGDERRLASTDPWGEAVFDDVPAASLPLLQVEVSAGS